MPSLSAPPPPRPPPSPSPSPSNRHMTHIGNCNATPLQHSGESFCAHVYPPYDEEFGNLDPGYDRPLTSYGPLTHDPTSTHSIGTAYGYAGAVQHSYWNYTVASTQANASKTNVGFGDIASTGFGLVEPHLVPTPDNVADVRPGPLPEINCAYTGCTRRFTRSADLERHHLHVHNRIGHNCQVPGCSNNKGNGYCRPDKLKEHMWKKHGQIADLSYVKVAQSPYGFDADA